MTEAPSAREHYRADGLRDRVRLALDAIAPELAPLTVEQLAPLDQFHTRGLAATADLSAAAALRPGETVLDIGCGLGGPARYLAATHAAIVTGVDLSQAFVETAGYLSQRCGLAQTTSFRAGDALDLTYADASFDLVFLQHVAMNVADRARLYQAVFRLLRSGGRFATYDIVARENDLLYPVPWAQSAATSHLMTEAQTRQALLAAGFDIKAWWDDSEQASAWFAGTGSAGPSPGPNLSLLLGPQFPAMAGNLRRNIEEGRAGVLAAVLVKP